MINKKAILFDLDNTFYEYEIVHKKALDNVYLVLKKEKNISQEEFINLYKTSKAEVVKELIWTASSHNRILYFQRLVEKLYNSIESNIILKLYNTYWDSFLENMKLKEWVIETLKILKERGFKIAIITDLTANIQLRKISKFKITSFIDVLVSSEEIGIEKPSPIIFSHTLKKLKISEVEAIMVWDNIINDIEWGNWIWLDTILITDKKIVDYKNNLQKPNYIIKEITEILNILNIK